MRHEILQQNKKMKKDIYHFLHKVEKWPNILKNLAVFTSQVFKSMHDPFSSLQRKRLNYNFQEFGKGIISIILCKTLILRNAETLPSKQNLLKVCSGIVISKSSSRIENQLLKNQLVFILNRRLFLKRL